MNIDIVIEIAKGDTVKYEFDHKKGKMRVDRFLHGAMYFPFNYGFIDETLGEDGDPLDVVVLASKGIIPGAIINCQPIGILEMEDEGGKDTKIIAVPTLKLDPLFGKMDSIDKIDESTKEKIKNFFEHYKDLEKGKWVKVEDWKPKEIALSKIEEARKRYGKKNK